MKSVRCVSLLVVPLLFALTGCGRAPLIPVKGKVTYKAYTLQQGLIVFTPDANRGENGAVAIGKIREDGSFELYTGDSKGATAGYYRVTICSLAAQNYNQTYGRFEFPQSYIPEKYRDPEQSRVFCEIQAGSRNDVNIELN